MSHPTTDPPTGPRTGTGRLRPVDITTARFDEVRRHGLNPGQVYPYLRRVAREMAAMAREVAKVTEEKVRLKTALVAWQAQQSSTRTPDGNLSQANPTTAPRSLRDIESPTDEWPTQSPHH